MKLTAETITDAQISALRAVSHGLADAEEIVSLCDIALGNAAIEPCLNPHQRHDCIANQIHAARGLCAGILNHRRNAS